MPDDFLEHYGVKGQRWGVRRTPEQLGHRGESTIKRLMKKIQKSSAKKKKEKVKKEEESDDKIREKVLKSTDPKYIYKHRSLLTDKELNDRINRINTEAKLKSMAEPKGELYKIAQSGDNWLKTTSSMANSVRNIYVAANTIKRLHGGGGVAPNNNQAGNQQKPSGGANTSGGFGSSGKSGGNKKSSQQKPSNVGSNKKKKDKKAQSGARGVRGIQWGVRETEKAMKYAASVSAYLDKDDPNYGYGYRLPNTGRGIR